jgi:hypothetical protein
MSKSQKNRKPNGRKDWTWEWENQRRPKDERKDNQRSRTNQLIRAGRYDELEEDEDR